MNAPKHQAKAVMVLGTTSGAGKSFLTTALCRWYARQGYKVAPFKAQNMSNNARVVPGLDGGYGEIGSAQYFQALASKAQPGVRMNPVLLKPEADTRSQVILMGQVAAHLADVPWRERSEHLWPAITASLDQLLAENDVVVIEGAGSPTEINLQANDIVNMRVARYAKAHCLLVTDIDRGGAFAHLYGTWHFLPPDERALIKGFVLNKFRGDANLLAPGPEMLEGATGVPTVAVLPMWRNHGLPEEDGIFDSSTSARSSATAQKIAVIAYPHLSNLDEFQPLKNIKQVDLHWVRSAAELKDMTETDLIILPGSKNTSADLAWLREQGLAECIDAHAQRGGRVLGICGGLQMLGCELINVHQQQGLNESGGMGLGLLNVSTRFEVDKTVAPISTSFAAMPRPWQALSNVSFTGYEIHHGITTTNSGADAANNTVQSIMPGDLGWRNAEGNVLGIYIHGLFENPQVMGALFGQQQTTLQQVFEKMADYVDQHFRAGFLQAARA